MSNPGLSKKAALARTILVFVLSATTLVNAAGGQTQPTQTGGGTQGTAPAGGLFNDQERLIDPDYFLDKDYSKNIDTRYQAGDIKDSIGLENVTDSIERGLFAPGHVVSLVGEDFSGANPSIGTGYTDQNSSIVQFFIENTQHEGIRIKTELMQALSVEDRFKAMTDLFRVLKDRADVRARNGSPGKQVVVIPNFGALYNSLPNQTNPANAVAQAIAFGYTENMGVIVDTTPVAHTGTLMRDDNVKSRITIVNQPPAARDAIMVHLNTTVRPALQAQFNIQIPDDAVAEAARIGLTWSRNQAMVRADQFLREAARQFAANLNGARNEKRAIKREVRLRESEISSLRAGITAENRQASEARIAELTALNVEARNRLTQLEVSPDGQSKALALRRKINTLQSQLDLTTGANRASDRATIERQMANLQAELMDLEDQVRTNRASDALVMDRLPISEVQKAAAVTLNEPLAAIALDPVKVARELPLIKEEIRGQDHLIDYMAQTYLAWQDDRIRAQRILEEGGTPERAKPFIIFIGGPTSEGKTMTADLFFERLGFPRGKVNLIEGSQLTLSQDVTKLIGGGPQYVGFEVGGRLTNPYTRDGKRVVANRVDEVGRMHHDVFQVFMQANDEAIVIDGMGRTADMADSMFVYTTNDGFSLDLDDNQRPRGIDMTNMTTDEKLQTLASFGVDTAEYTNKQDWEIEAKVVERLLVRKFGGAVPARLPKIMVTKRLTPEVMQQIAHDQFRNYQRKLQDEGGIKIVTDQAVIDRVVQDGIRANLGARGLINRFNELVLNPAKDLLAQIRRDDLSVPPEQAFLQSGSVLSVTIDENGAFDHRVMSRTDFETSLGAEATVDVGVLNLGALIAQHLLQAADETPANAADFLRAYDARYVLRDAVARAARRFGRRL